MQRPIVPRAPSALRPSPRRIANASSSRCWAAITEASGDHAAPCPVCSGCAGTQTKYSRRHLVLEPPQLAQELVRTHRLVGDHEHARRRQRQRAGIQRVDYRVQRHGRGRASLPIRPDCGEVGAEHHGKGEQAQEELRARVVAHAHRDQHQHHGGDREQGQHRVKPHLNPQTVGREFRPHHQLRDCDQQVHEQDDRTRRVEQEQEHGIGRDVGGDDVRFVGSVWDQELLGNQLYAHAGNATPTATPSAAPTRAAIRTGPRNRT